MQFEVDFLTYRKSKNNIEERSYKNNKYLVFAKLIICFLMSFFIARVLISININNLSSIAPFGIAYIIAILSFNYKKNNLISTLGVITGYVSIHKSLENILMYVLIVAGMFLLANLLYKIKSKINDIIYFIFILSFLSIFSVSFNNMNFFKSLTFAIIQTALIYLISYMIKYGVKYIVEFNITNYVSSEEVISILLLLCLAISGIGNVILFGSINIRNIIALFSVLAISYITTGYIGAAFGLSLGIIIGMTTNNMILYISIYGVCGLVISMFKEAGKLFSIFAYIVIYLILIIYSKQLEIFIFPEVITSCLFFILIPKKIYKKLSICFNREKKKQFVDELHLNKVKEDFSYKLGNFTEVLHSISSTLDNLVDNEKILTKNTGNSMVENLTDRVCSNCDMKKTCWKREMQSTYNAFSELIRNHQEGTSVVPEVLRKKCLKEYALIKNTEEIVNNYITGQMVKRKIGEGRKLLANYIDNMATTINEISQDFSREINLDFETEKIIKRELIRNSLKYDGVLCYKDKNSRLNIKIFVEGSSEKDLLGNEILNIVNLSLNKNMTILKEDYFLEEEINKYSISIEESPKYSVVSNIASVCKDGEKFTGDSYNFGETKDGNYLVVLSDGMGSGKEAGIESKATVDIIDKFAQCGFDQLTAINIVNSIMSMKFMEEETFATLDMFNINLYTGNCAFMKIGSVESFIKRDDKIYIVNSSTLPFGVLDEVDVDITDKKLIEGDLIITVSDGVLEVGGDRASNYEWIVDLLRSTNIKNPKELSDEIISMSKQLNSGKIKDDMTVIVSKLVKS